MADNVQCAAHGIYTVIDLHALPGGKHRRWIRVAGRGVLELTSAGQNIDWHSDNGTHQALCERFGSPG